MKRWTFPAALVLLALIASSVFAQAVAPKPDSKPKVAVFPLAGDAPDATRERVWFSLRTKLNRDGHYEAIDGPTMTDLLSGVERPVNFDTPEKTVADIAKGVEADVLVWGQMDADPVGLGILKLRVVDLRQADLLPHEFSQPLNEPTDVRFAVEQVLETLAGVNKFEHPDEQAVHHDAQSDALWQSNPNLVVNGDFSAAGKAWEAILGPDRYEPKLTGGLPDTDKVVIFKEDDGRGGTNNVLAMNLSRGVAENNGLACLSAAMEIQPDTRYRLSFRYNSKGPRLHVFIKGYALVENINGQKAQREVYRRQVPPTEGTNGAWVEVVDDLNPQHVQYPVQWLRVDLYAYLNPGLVMFDDIMLKAVGQQTRRAKDSAIKPPSTVPIRKR